MRFSQIVAVLFFTAFLFMAGPAQADATDPSGYALKSYVESYLQNAMEHDALAEKIKQMGGADSSGVYEWLCSLEVSNTLSVGYNVWEARMQADSYYLENTTMSQFIPLNITNYCITYSNRCSHWEWDKDCLKRQFK